MVRYGFSKQLAELCSWTAYKSFGIHLPPIPPTMVKGIYKSSIARQVYEHYRSQDFKFADQGVTPRQIAEQLQVHFKPQGHLDWSMDQFSNFNFTPHPSYIQATNAIIQPTYHHVLVKEAMEIIGTIKSETHNFYYHMDKDITVSELSRIFQMEIQARVLEEINGHSVRRYIVSGQNMQKSAMQQIARIIMGPRSYNTCTIQKLYLSPQSTSQINHFCCNPESTVHFQKYLPHFILFKQFMVQQQSKKVLSFSQSDLKNQIKRSPKRKQKTQSLNQQITQLINKKMLVLHYGNLLDQFQFDRIRCLFNTIQPKSTLNKERKYIQKSFDQLSRIYFQ